MSERTHRGQPAGLASMPPTSLPRVSFRKELEALLAQRRNPVLAREYTIGGSIEEAVHSQVRERNEVRASVIANRLRDVRGHAEAVFTLSALETRAAGDFERSR